jgi:hypothetical protein
MKRIKVNSGNGIEIDNLIIASEIGCKVRKITVQDIFDTTLDILAWLNQYKIPLKVRKGLKFNVDIHAQVFPRAYKYTPESTHFAVEIGSNGKDFYLVQVVRYRTDTKKIRFEVTQAVKDAIVTTVLGQL